MGLRRGSAAVAVVVACMALAGCQQVQDVLARPTDEALLNAVSLTQRDVADGALLQDYEGGTEVVGRTSLDLCFGDFPSEDLRVGRTQVGISQEQGDAWVSSEAILYATPDQARQAMEELTRAYESCPEELVEAPQPDREPLQWEFAEPPDADWPQEPGVQRQAYQFVVTSSAGEQMPGTATYLRRGRMILALYATPPDSPQDVIRNAPDQARFTEVMANRLAALPERALLRANPGTGPADPQDIDT